MSLGGIYMLLGLSFVETDLCDLHFVLLCVNVGICSGVGHSIRNGDDFRSVFRSFISYN